MPSVSKNFSSNGKKHTASPVSGWTVGGHELINTRLLTELMELAHVPLRMVVAPAGYGKTTSLRQLAARAGATGATVPVWYTASAAEVSPPAFVRRLATAFGSALGGGATRVSRLDTLLSRLRTSDDDFTVFVDDADRLAGRPSADALTRLLNEAPPNTHFVVATRSSTTPDISRLTAIRPIHRIDHRDLRLRPWETELLFRVVYRQRLAPDLAAELCAWTEGWPAALCMVGADSVARAAHGESPGTRRPLWTSLQTREYVTKHVLGPVPAEVRDVMIRMSALGVLSGGLCDALLDRTDSARLLRKLAENQVLTWPSERDSGCFRFHRLLQSHLEDQLAQRLGPEELRAWYRRAATELTRFGYWPEACRAYAHAQDWVSVGEILRHHRADGDDLFDAAIVPRSVLDHDPWLALARARLLRADGDLAAACHAYQEARSGFDQPGIRWQCANERAAVARWLGPPSVDEPPQPRANDLSGAVFEAMRGQPGRLLVRPRQTDDPNWRLACALAAAMDGRRGPPAELLNQPMAGDGTFVSLASRLAAAVLAASAHQPSGTAMVFTTLALEAETAGWPWLARIARAAPALTDSRCCRDALAVRDECLASGDDWGALVAGVLLSAGLIRAAEDAEPALRSAIGTARQLGATVPELWLTVMLADHLARIGDPAADAERLAVRIAAERVQVPRAVTHGAQFMAALRATKRTGQARADDRHAFAGADAVSVPVLIRCLGPYEFLVNGDRLELSGLRPQARLLLRLLSLSTVDGVRDGKLIGAIWPDTPADLARHRLHVALSSVRRLLRRQAAPLPVDVIRHEDAYLLDLPEGSQVDLLLFDEAVRQWRARGGMAASDESVEFGLRALRLYRGDLLGSDGCATADLAVVERDRLCTEAATVATMLAGWALDRGDVGMVVQLCRRGLQIDELNDQLWQLMAEAQRRTGNQAAARRALRTYEDLFADGAPEQATSDRTIPFR